MFQWSEAKLKIKLELIVVLSGGTFQSNGWENKFELIEDNTNSHCVVKEDNDHHHLFTTCICGKKMFS